MTPDTAMAQLDSHIYRMRAATGSDPAQLTITQEQARALSEWAGKRKMPQDKVRMSGNVVSHYRGIQVRVR